MTYLVPQCFFFVFFAPRVLIGACHLMLCPTHTAFRQKVVYDTHVFYIDFERHGNFDS